jgi:hypothetical protein
LPILDLNFTAPTSDSDAYPEFFQPAAPQPHYAKPPSKGGGESEPLCAKACKMCTFCKKKIPAKKINLDLLGFPWICLDSPRFFRNQVSAGLTVCLANLAPARTKCFRMGIS